MLGIKVPFLLKPNEDKNFPSGIVVEPVVESPGWKKYGIVQHGDDCGKRKLTICIFYLSIPYKSKRMA